MKHPVTCGDRYKEPARKLSMVKYVEQRRYADLVMIQLDAGSWR